MYLAWRETTGGVCGMGGGKINLVGQKTTGGVSLAHTALDREVADVRCEASYRCGWVTIKNLQHSPYGTIPILTFPS